MVGLSSSRVKTGIQSEWATSQVVRCLNDREGEEDCRSFNRQTSGIEGEADAALSASNRGRLGDVRSGVAPRRPVERGSVVDRGCLKIGWWDDEEGLENPSESLRLTFAVQSAACTGRNLCPQEKGLGLLIASHADRGSVRSRPLAKQGFKRVNSV